MSGSLPKVDPPELVETVRRLYVDEGLTQCQVAAEIEASPSVVERIMKRYGIPSRKLSDYPSKTRGPNHGGWRTENIQYGTLHYRVYASRGKPSECTVCRINDPDRRYEWANLTGDYENVQDYARMCVPCHRSFDRQRRLETGTNTSPYNSEGVKV